jgi:hypothetical protein
MLKNALFTIVTNRECLDSVLAHLKPPLAWYRAVLRQDGERHLAASNAVQHSKFISKDT